MGTGTDTGTAVQATLWMETYLRSGIDPLGIVAPRTMKGAPFEKNRSANSGTVVQAESLDIKNDPRLSFH
jgi:hypothetical protein